MTLLTSKWPAYPKMDQVLKITKNNCHHEVFIESKVLERNSGLLLRYLRATFYMNQAVSGNLQKWMFQKCLIFPYFTQNNERNNSEKYFFEIFIFNWVIEAQSFNIFTGKSARRQNFGFRTLVFPMGTGIHQVLLLFTKLEAKLYQ